MKKNELKLNELEKKQRENESAYANLQMELDVKSIKIDSEETFIILTKQNEQSANDGCERSSKKSRNWQSGSQSSPVCDGITKDLQAEVNHLIKAALEDMKNNHVVSHAMPLICKHPEKDCFIIPDESRSWIDSLLGPFRIAIING